MRIRTRTLILAVCVMSGAVPIASSVAVAQDATAKPPATKDAATKDAAKPAAVKTIELADGKMLLKAPADWKSVPPKSQIVQFEFLAPTGDVKPEDQARITVMGAGGSISDNIDRWYGQFEQPDGSATKEKSKAEKIEVAGQTIHLVDIPGTFKDAGGGPFFQQRAPVMREKYRMLAAIIETKDMGQHFLKITGPDATVEKLKDGFHKMLQGLEVKK